ncbi:MAG: aldo/keto reductase [Acidobacteria bacterium]|nr:aldo/keto reductase [Acidobacteriota bacterium]MBI3422685.1 aldo/keto reductase [Acidobacteriota bacterium]
MEQRKLGTQGLTVSALGLGCMQMSGNYGPANEAEGIATIHEALELGINFFDTAEVYGPFENEKLVGRALKGKREQAIIATKFGFQIQDGRPVGTDSRPAHVKEVCDASLQRLGVDHIDLFYQHRVDKNVPIEDTVGALAELVKAGKVRYIGLSEAGAANIRRAHAVHPISALQSEYSLWERNIEAEVLPTIRELGIGLVPYSPLGRGFLTGTAKRAEDMPEGDWRKSNVPRFQGENFDRNMALVAAVKEIAARKGCTPAQMALAWLLHLGQDIVPIPGTKRLAYMRENTASANVVLTAEDMQWIDERLPAGAAVGDRYYKMGMSLLDN